jgi:hypothetical protein
MRATGKYWWMTAFMALLALLSSLAMTQLRQDSPEWFLWIAIIPNGFGVSGLITSTLIALIGSVKREDMAVATGSKNRSSLHTIFTRLTLPVVSYMFRTTGQVLGVSLASSIAQSVLTKRLVENLKGPDASKVRPSLTSQRGPIADLYVETDHHSDPTFDFFHS